MSWSDKSKDSDLFFCVTNDCNVITFRPGPLGRNVCPKCWVPGSVVRSQAMLSKGIRSESVVKQESSDSP